MLGVEKALIFTEKSHLPMDAYELERDAINVAFGQMVQAGREGSQRGAGQISGQVHFKQALVGQAAVRTDIADRYYLSFKK